MVLRGRFAGRKAVVVRTSDGHDQKRPYGHAIVAGIERYPLKVTKSMGKKKVVKRSKIKPFVKTLNYNHVMPTRYIFQIFVYLCIIDSNYYFSCPIVFIIKLFPAFL